MALDTIGILTPIDFPLEQVTPVTAVLRQVFVNEAPLWSMLPHRPKPAQKYQLDQWNPRNRTFALGTGDLTNVATTLPIADASVFQVGDVLELADGTNVERVEVLAAPVTTTTPNTLTIRRGREGTTGTAFATATPTAVKLISNSRTGGEVDQQASRVVRTQITQVVQTFQYPVQVGGLADAIRNVSLPPGQASVFGLDRAVKAVEMIRDVENAFYLETGEVPAAAGDRAKMYGLIAQIKNYAAGANYTAAAGASYTRTAFIAATIAKIYASGQMPDTIICATDFLSGLDTWVPLKTTFMGQGQTSDLGFPINRMVLPLNSIPLTFYPSLQLPKGSALVLTSSDLEIGYIREMFWQPRGNRGDAMMGDWIGDYTIQAGHPQWHAFVGGITSYA